MSQVLKKSLTSQSSSVIKIELSPIESACQNLTDIFTKTVSDEQWNFDAQVFLDATEDCIRDESHEVSRTLNKCVRESVLSYYE